MICLCLVALSAFATPSAPAPGIAQALPIEVTVRQESVSLVDSSRSRTIPVEIYSAQTPRPQRIAIVSHGYGYKNTVYGFIARHLAARGYLVASIQHEIEGDAPLPTTGKPYDVRMPSWENGSRSILFVLTEMGKRHPGLDIRNALLVGHSHGGDTSMVFARDHPELVEALISLDNRRMPFPRSSRPRILSMRSSDQPPDDGVIPSSEEQVKFGMRVVKLPATIHNDMFDGATEAQKAEMLRHIDGFLDAK